MAEDWKGLDTQLRKYAPFVRDELKIITPDSEQIATAIARELAVLSTAALSALVEDDNISVSDRLDELIAFQSWMELSHELGKHPIVVRAQVITLNYILFVYLGDALFKNLKKKMPSGSVTKKCSKFLTDNPVRAFRNAVAHANWHYLPDFSGLEFWARKGDDPTAPMACFKVSQIELDFWQSVARAVAYVVYTEIERRN